MREYLVPGSVYYVSSRHRAGHGHRPDIVTVYGNRPSTASVLAEWRAGGTGTLMYGAGDTVDAPGGDVYHLSEPHQIELIKEILAASADRIVVYGQMESDWRWQPAHSESKVRKVKLAQA